MFLYPPTHIEMQGTVFAGLLGCVPPPQDSPSLWFPIPPSAQSQEPGCSLMELPMMGRKWGVGLEGGQHNEWGRVPRSACFVFQLGLYPMLYSNS